jgi:uncharacterized protein YyaL (SSP411 family)
MNELSKETSPYLLQHASNPVHWKAWNQSSLDIVKETNQLLLISVGYSACHWCHVMEHESFEDFEVANTMNQHFVSIKVDREERPDVDAIYMKAVQIMTGRGGWPLNVVCLPDGRPVWGGTYFRKNDWINTLEQLQEIYQSEPEKMIEYANQLHEGINSLGINISENASNGKNLSIPNQIMGKWEKSFDWEFGGYTRAPKFMMPCNYQFLMAYGFLNKDQNLLDYVNLTLTKMAYGGIFDTLDGGFSRYAVDTKWHIPHFEKMAYDNGQLLSLYADAYKLTKNELYKEIIEKTFDFISREWLASNGSFYAALDADSINEKGILEEGAFYVWTKEDLEKILNKDFELFSKVFNINTFGFWEHENYVLIQTKSLEELAQENEVSIEYLSNKKKTWEKLLFEKRELRKKPRLDDKCITSWNALIIKGLIDCYKAIPNNNYLTTALKNAQFILEKLWAPEGNLFRSFKNEKVSINGFLEDYATVVQAFIGLYEVTLDEKWLHHSKSLVSYCLDHFYDENKKLFRFTSNLDPELIATNFEIEDNVIPASNSIMASNLCKLSIYFENSFYEKIARQMVEQIIPNIDYPSAYSNWLTSAFFFSEHRKEVAICGTNSLELVKEFNQKYLPQVLIAGTNQTSDLPFLKNRFVANETNFYLCQNKTCLAPLKNSAVLYKELNS